MAAQGPTQPVGPPPMSPAEREELMALVEPRPRSITRGLGKRVIGLGDRKVTCSASMADAVLQDREEGW